MCAHRVMLDQRLTRVRRPTALGSRHIRGSKLKQLASDSPGHSRSCHLESPVVLCSGSVPCIVIRAGRPLAEGITPQPSSWQRDLKLRDGDVELRDLEQLSVKSESAAADSSLGPRVKRQKVHLDSS